MGMETQRPDGEKKKPRKEEGDHLHQGGAGKCSLGAGNTPMKLRILGCMNSQKLPPHFVGEEMETRRK